MLYEKDYFMKAILQLAKALAELIFKRKEGKFDVALVIANSALERILGMNSKLVNSISTSDLIELIKEDGILNADKAVFVAVLLKEEADIFEETKIYEESYSRYLKSLNLFLEVYINDYKTNFEEYFDEMHKLVERLDKYQLPYETKNRLILYFEKEGKYSKAEDLLYELMEENNHQNRTIQMGILFYERLMKHSDIELINGKLPRGEVNDGLAALRKIEAESIS